MNRDELLDVLRAHKATLAQRFGVTKLALFGSVVRNQLSKDSDVDILVSFQGRADWRRYFGVQFYLKDLLGHPINLVTDKALRVTPHSPHHGRTRNVRKKTAPGISEPD